MFVMAFRLPCHLPAYRNALRPPYSGARPPVSSYFQAVFQSSGVDCLSRGEHKCDIKFRGREVSPEAKVSYNLERATAGLAMWGVSLMKSLKRSLQISNDPEDDMPTCRVCFEGKSPDPGGTLEVQGFLIDVTSAVF